MAHVRILIAESQYLIVEGLKSILSRYNGLELCACAENKETLFQILHAKEIDIVILDPLNLDHFRIDDLDTLFALNPTTHVLIISEISKQDAVHRIVETGVRGYLTKTCDEKEIIDAIYALMGGEKMYCHKVLNILLAQEKEGETDCAATVLSEREVEIIRLIANGYTTRQIADTLFRSFHTITTHRRNIMKKLGINSASELMIYAVNTGLIQPREMLHTDA